MAPLLPAMKLVTLAIKQVTKPFAARFALYVTNHPRMRCLPPQG